MNRCGTCRGEWDEKGDPPADLVKAKRGMSIVDISATYSDSIAVMSTEADFGCVLWEQGA